MSGKKRTKEPKCRQRDPDWENQWLRNWRAPDGDEEFRAATRKEIGEWALETDWIPAPEAEAEPDELVWLLSREFAYRQAHDHCERKNWWRRLLSR